MYQGFRDKLNLIWRFDFSLEPIFATAQAALEHIDHFKSGQKRPKNNHLTYFIQVQSKSLMHPVVYSMNAFT